MKYKEIAFDKHSNENEHRTKATYRKIVLLTNDDICHFYTITEWKDIESIINFAGNDYEKARYYPEDKEYLIELEEPVNHYETYY